MKNKKILIIMICLIWILTGCSKNDSAADNPMQDYRPMVFVKGNLYGDTGDVVTTLPEGWEVIGEIEQIQPQTEPLSEVEFTSNSLEVGDKIYYNDGVKESIYAGVEGDKYLIYELIE